MASDTSLKQEEIERIFQGFTLEAQKQMTEQFQKPKKRVIILAGPTGAGKSDLSMLLAESIYGEIISSDSI